jgi:hypothetical protein
MSIVEIAGAGAPPPWLRPAVYALSLVGLALGIVVAITGNPVASALALAAPLAALGLTACAPALFEIRRRRGGRGFNPLVGVGVLGAIFAAIGPDLFDAHMQLIGGAAGLAAGLAAAFATPARRSLGAPIQYAALMAMFGALYGMAAVTVVDVRFDRAPAQVYRTSVTGKYETHGRTTGYHLDLAPWGPQAQAGSVGVSGTAYAAAQPGDPICMSLHPGVLGAPWYVVTPCPAAPAPRAAF